MTGYVRLHRSLIGHPAFRNDAEAMAFAWMVARAAWKPSCVRYKGRAISLNRGQLAISVRFIPTVQIGSVDPEKRGFVHVRIIE